MMREKIFLDVLKSRAGKETKQEAICNFKEMMEFTFQHPMMREMYCNRKEYMMYMKEIPYVLLRYIDEISTTI